MTPERLRALLAEVAAGALTVDDAERRLAWEPFEDLDFASVDHHRALRQGFPEVVFGQGKTPEQIAGIAARIAPRGDGFLATRLADDAAEMLAAKIPAIELNPLGRTAYLPPAEPVARKTRGSVLIVTAGTSDLPVAEEAAVTAAAFGNPVERLTDVGVAGIHRLLARTDRLRSASVVIVVAGMEGALPSVVGGLVAVPVIAVPTSVGYGASFGGIAALLGMLNSCASGVTVVNIDNGFGAAAAASRINLLPAS
ncbi:nickel pincer cofactor biosynthesis protein LarB [Longimicrobium sp.]|uniref:nickel pincer cofactor biosynthesis protein LarB n=1 Tax=Longimicrobium sp. TaxID=2029185 RepID=UPI002C26D737|nr:nickel pincer cofactor biosynthesis protein LarB [Longimicrobium sp.]HSU17321.1 nickel pincer cofactor biosynthesis protein LarB [Longimicrobium sp.]